MKQATNCRLGADSASACARRGGPSASRNEGRRFRQEAGHAHIQCRPGDLFDSIGRTWRLGATGFAFAPRLPDWRHQRPAHVCRQHRLVRKDEARCQAGPLPCRTGDAARACGGGNRPVVDGRISGGDRIFQRHGHRDHHDGAHRHDECTTRRQRGHGRASRGGPQRQENRRHRGLHKPSSPSACTRPGQPEAGGRHA